MPQFILQRGVSSRVPLMGRRAAAARRIIPFSTVSNSKENCSILHPFYKIKEAEAKTPHTSSLCIVFCRYPVQNIRFPDWTMSRVRNGWDGPQLWQKLFPYDSRFFHRSHESSSKLYFLPPLYLHLAHICNLHPNI